MNPSEENILEVKGISKRFPGVQALNKVHFELRRGEIHALIGENGTGKSTLMKILLGIYHPDEGEIYFKGKCVAFKNPHAALNSGICMIHQEISLVSAMSVDENIWMGRENEFRKYGFLSSKDRRERTQALLDELGISLNAKETVQNLSIASMQLIEIARAVSYKADVIIMDEPTSALTDTEVKLLFGIMRKLAGAGTAIVFISHKLEEIFEISDRITVLRDGEYIATTQTHESEKNELIRMIVGRELTTMFPKMEAEIGETVLEVKNLCSGKKLKNISFTLRKGEILGICGLMGAGRTELASAIFGIEKFESGEILLNGKPVRFKSPKQAVRHGMGMVTEDRLNMGIIAQLPVRINITLAYLYKIVNKLSFVDFKREKADCREIIKKLGVKVSTQEQAISSLSGGNQQKAIIARWLLAQPGVLILDEPTRGIDVGSKAEIHYHISKLAQQGIAIIMISSELPEILGMSDRILVMREGSIAGRFNRDEVDQETAIKVAFGA